MKGDRGMFCIRAQLVLLLTVTTVTGRELIVPQGTVTKGTPFNIYCDASRVGPLDKDVSIIYRLQLSRQLQREYKSRDLADYHIISRQMLTGEKAEHTPPGRDWSYEFDGRLSIGDQEKLWKNDWKFVQRYNNINTMKLKIWVWDGTLHDAGTYECCVTYRLPGTSPRRTSVCSKQIVTAHVKGRQPIIPVGLVTEEVPFTIHCDGTRVLLPENIKMIKRLKVERKPQGASDKLYTTLAEYSVWNPFGVFSAQNIPESRDWSITFDGMHNGLNDSKEMNDPDPPWSKLRNVDTARITVLVEDSKIEDAGTYQCTVEYYSTEYSWRPPFSTHTVDFKRCSDDRYGQNCTMTCSTGCNVVKCDKSTGACPGTCKDGFHGESCSFNCSGHCVGGKCAKETAECGCKDGYYGKTCTFTCHKNCRDGKCEKFKGECDCKDGYHGLTCNSKCSKNCKDGKCEKDTGYCDCAKGFYGTDCETKCSAHCKDGICHRFGGCECKNGYFGHGCEFTCGKGCADGKCDGGSGACECAAGYFDMHCDKACSKNCKDKYCDKLSGECRNCQGGYYGWTCSYPCSRNCKNGTCRRDGECDCTDGFYGHHCIYGCFRRCLSGKCEKETGHCDCDKGYYGERCNKRCELSPKCKDGLCEKLTGDCKDCLDGMYGQDCSQRCANYCKDGICQRETGYCHCPNGFWGEECTKQCPSSCAPGICKKDTGECGCDAGSWGVMCSQVCNKECENNCDLETGECLPEIEMSTFVGIGVALTVIAAAGIIGVLAIFKAKKGRDTSRPMEETTVNAHTSAIESHDVVASSKGDISS